MSVFGFYVTSRGLPVQSEQTRRIVLSLYRDRRYSRSVFVTASSSDIRDALEDADFGEPQLWRAMVLLTADRVEGQIRAGNFAADGADLVVSPAVALAAQLARFQPDRPFTGCDQVRRFDWTA